MQTLPTPRCSPAPLPRAVRAAAAGLLAAVAALGAPAIAAPQGAAVEERPLVASRLERWLADGDKELIVQSFRRHPSEVLPFFDQYLERGLKLIENKATDEEAMKEFRKGIQFAQLATDALRDPIFIEYAGNFASWNDGERQRFRRGQAEYKQGAIALRKGDAAAAAEHFRESAALAEALGDSWGLQMALAGTTRTAAALGQLDAAWETAGKAMEIAGRLQQRDDEVEVIVICAESRLKLALPDAGLGHARLAWSKLKPGDPAEMRERAARVLVAALEAKNLREEAAKIRAEACLDDSGGATPDGAARTPGAATAPAAPGSKAPAAPAASSPAAPPK